MAPHGRIASDEELQHAGQEGLRGAIHGAAVWGIGSLLLGLIAHTVSPVYRGLTFQFKVYLQMSGMTIGSIIEADRRMRDYEKHARRMRRIRQDEQARQALEGAYLKSAAAQREKDSRERQKEG